MSEPRYTEKWLAEVMAATYLKDRAKLCAYGMSRFADWETGRDCYPSDPTVAAIVGVDKRTARRGRLDLESAGWITRTGIGRPKNATDYALVRPASADKVVPTSADKVVPTESSSADKVVPTELRQYGQLRQSVRTAEAVSADKVVLQPPHTSSDRREDEGEESAYAPPPDGGALALPDVAALREDIVEFLRQHWNGKVPAWSNTSRQRLDQLVADGWTHEQIMRGVAQVTASPTSPSLLLEAHLKRLLTKHQPDDFPEVTDTPTPTPAEDTATAGAGDGEKCRHGIPYSRGDDACADCVALRVGLKQAFDTVKNLAFSITRDRRDEDGDMTYTMLAGPVTIEVVVDIHNDPYSLTMYVRHPEPHHLAVLHQFGEPITTPDGVETFVGTDIGGADIDTFPETLIWSAQQLRAPAQSPQPAAATPDDVPAADDDDPLAALTPEQLAAIEMLRSGGTDAEGASA